jgi:ribosomal protein L32
MQIGDPKIKICPNCGHENIYYPGPFFVHLSRHIVWSDGVQSRETPSLKESRLQKCPNCHKFYWHKRKLGGLSFTEYLDALNIYEKKYIIKQRIFKEYRDRVIYIRFNIWRTYNSFLRPHPYQEECEPVKVNINQDWTKAYIKNAKELIKLLSTDNKNTLYIAELYRNIGDFDNAKNTLERLKDDESKQIKDVLLKEIALKNEKTVITNWDNSMSKPDDIDV